jgi:uncharacterized protein YijF (DUF1287 family)
MSERKRVRQRSSDLRRARCRVCRKEINFQSYPNHLQLSHPEEDSDDRREAGQTTLFGSVKVKKVVQVGMNGYYKLTL